jgi:hypothetical protein
MLLRDSRTSSANGAFGRLPRALFIDEAVVLMPATAAVLPGLSLWPSAHPFGRLGAATQLVRYAGAADIFRAANSLAREINSLSR